MSIGGSAHWLSGPDLAAMFAVAPSTLELYRLRGALPAVVDGRGRPLYDPRAVAAIFRRRGAVAPQPGAVSFGVLGSMTLGQAPAAAGSIGGRAAPAPFAQRLPGP